MTLHVAGFIAALTVLFASMAGAMAGVWLFYRIMAAGIDDGE
jgi:hypothetical protein